METLLIFTLGFIVGGGVGALLLRIFR